MNQAAWLSLLLFSAFALSAAENVMDFGAKGDGKTDDSDACRKAVAALPQGGGAVYFPATRNSYRFGSTCSDTDVFSTSSL